MARQNLVVVTGARLSGSVAQARGRPHAAGVIVSYHTKAHARCRYINSLLNGRDDQVPDVRYAHFADEEAARRHAKLLIQELASSGFYSSRSCLLEVKDESGPLFSMPFR